MIALSHPQLRAETTIEAVCDAAQQFVNVIDLEENSFKTLRVQDVLQADYPDLRYIASIDKGDHLEEVLSGRSFTTPDQLVLTFNYLTRDRKFVKLMRTALRRLEEAYEVPVEIEFVLDVVSNQSVPDYKLYILECRPLSWRTEQR